MPERVYSRRQFRLPGGGRQGRKYEVKAEPVADPATELRNYLRQLMPVQVAQLSEAADDTIDLPAANAARAGSPGYHAVPMPPVGPIGTPVPPAVLERAAGFERERREIARGRRGAGAYPGAAPSGPVGPAQPGHGVGYDASQSEIESYIADEASKRNMDPNYAVRVYRGEGRSNYVGDHGTSFGPYQLHVGGGLGDVFFQETGLDPRDRSTWREQVQWSLNYASQHGWEPWHGRPGGRGGATHVGIAGSHPVPLHERTTSERVGSGTLNAGRAMNAGPRRGAMNKDRVTEYQQNATRNQPIQDDLRGQLNYAAARTGVGVEVWSGGQPSSGPRRTGSHRHDWGGAADLKLRDEATGRLLDMRNPEDAQRMADFVSLSVQAGATGVGAGLGYMGPHSLHIGGGRQTSWGGAPWINPALQRGIRMRRTFAEDLAAMQEQQKAEEDRAALDGSTNKGVKAAASAAAGSESTSDTGTSTGEGAAPEGETPGGSESNGGV